jgi:hypothetical protein
MQRFALAALCALLSATAALASVPRNGPVFSAHVKLAPGHYIDRDTGLDCEDAGALTACQPPDGTVRYFDPAQGAACTRAGAAVLCSN